MPAPVHRRCIAGLLLGAIFIPGFLEGTEPTPTPPVSVPLSEPLAVSPDQRKAEKDLKEHREAVSRADEDYQIAVKVTGKDSVRTRDAREKLEQERKALEKVLYEQGKVSWPVAPTTSPGPKSPAGPPDTDASPPARQVEF